MKHRSISAMLPEDQDVTGGLGVHLMPGTLPHQDDSASRLPQGRRRPLPGLLEPLQEPQPYKWPASVEEHDLLSTGGAQYIKQPAASASETKRAAAGPDVVREFHEALARSPDMAVAVAAIKALTSVIQRSSAQTMMGLDADLQAAAMALQSCNPTAISLKAGCELFLRYATRTSALEADDFQSARARLIQRGNHFAKTSVRARATIAELGARFIRSGATVLVHGYSRVVLEVLKQAATRGSRFSIIVTEGRPDNTGLNMARALDGVGIPTTLVLDSGAAYCLDRVSLVLVGAEGVVENGGIINKLGTYQLAICAKTHGIPFYAAAESYKFARLYPLSQGDLPVEPKHVDLGSHIPAGLVVDNPSRDYTPPSYITLLFTDLGVRTPAAVSDELILDCAV